MTSIAEFTLPPADFPLGRVFDTRPEARFELDRVVPSGDTAMPYFWVYGSDMPGVLAILDDLPELRAVVLMDDLGDRGLFRAEWHPDHLGIMRAIAESGVTVVSAAGSASGWTFQLRAGTPAALSAFTEYCGTHDLDVTLTRLSRLAESTPDTGAYGLTPEQREALLMAYEAGYYDDPRGVHLDELADRLDITRQAFAARLRRGYRNVIEATLTDDE